MEGRRGCRVELLPLVAGLFVPLEALNPLGALGYRGVLQLHEQSASGIACGQRDSGGTCGAANTRRGADGSGSGRERAGDGIAGGGIVADRAAPRRSANVSMLASAWMSRTGSRCLPAGGDSD